MWKKIGIWLAFVAMLLCMSVSVYAQGGDMAGTGTEDDPYQIEDAADLIAFQEKVNTGGEAGACAILTDDITLNEEVLTAEGSLNEGQKDTFIQWTPIGSNRNKYIGTFDGNGKTISGLYINDSSVNYVGFFGYIGSGGEIKDLTIEDSYISGNNYAGGVCGSNSGTITNCSNTGAVSGEWFVGGVCGNNAVSSTIENCDHTGTVNGSEFIGGVCGNNIGTTQNCYNTGAVSGDKEVGGVCGHNNSYGTIKNCYNTGDVGRTGNSVGGVCGWNENGIVENCYNTGTVSGSDDIGGVTGMSDFDATTKNCYNSGTVSGTSKVGGVCGSYSMSGTLENCYNTGTVNGTNNVGGVCGQDESGDTAKNCYYLDTCCTGSNSYGQSLTADQFRDKSQFSDWDFDTIWQMDTIGLGRPFLRSIPEESEYGSGTEQDPYLIYTIKQLEAFRDAVNGGETDLCAILMENITLNTGVLNEDGSLKGDGSSLEEWTPIGTETNGYTGIFDGNDKTISGLYIKDSRVDYVGFFGYIDSDAEVKDLTIGDSYISGNNYVGGVSGYNGGTITNCCNSGTVSGNSDVGGVCGRSMMSSITNCYNTGSVIGDSGVGGVCGYNYTRTTTNCYNSGTVNGSGKIGGVCGWNDMISTVTSCYNTGSVSGNNEVGGVCGYNDADSTIENCYNTGNIEGPSDVGGVCGYSTMESTILNCYNTGSVIGDSEVGGVCGYNYGKPTTNCYFLSGTAESGIGYGGADTDEAIEKTAAAFASGEVTWLLDKEQAQWEQQLGTDQLPRLVMTEDGQEYDVVAVTITLPDQTLQIIYTNADQILQNYPQPAAKDKVYEFYEEDTYVTKINTAKKVYTADAVIYAKEVDVKAEDTTSTSSSGTTTHRYDLTFNTNGGKMMASVEKRENVTIDLSQYIPEREGYVFVGWYLDEALTQPVSSLKLSRNTTLYAKWEKASETTVPTTIFADVQAGDWFYNAVNYAVEHGLMSGTGEDMFQPGKAFTREMLAVVLWNLEGKPQSGEQNTFTDVADGMWYTKAVTWAKEEGIVAGFGEKFGVGMPITREQFAVMLHNYAQYQGYDVSVGENTNILSYPDALSISDYAYSAMQWVCSAGVMTGDDLGRLNPQGQTTRAEAAQMLMNFCKNVVE